MVRPVCPQLRKHHVGPRQLRLVPFPDLDRNRQCAKGQAAMPSAVRVKHTAQEAGVPIVTGLGPRNSCKDRHPPDAIVLW